MARTSSAYIDGIVALDNKLMALHDAGAIFKAISASRSTSNEDAVDVVHDVINSTVVEDTPVNDEYNSFYELVSEKTPVYRDLVKQIIIDMRASSFHRERSVEIFGNHESPYLKEKYGDKYTLLAKVNLLAHTRHVVEQIIDSNGEVPPVALELMIIMALIHDFGKATHIKKHFANSGNEHHEMVSANYLNVVASKKIEPETLNQMSETILRMHNRHRDGRLTNDFSRALLSADESARTAELSELHRESGGVA